MQLLTGPPVIAVALVAIAAIASPAHATITLTALISRGAQALLDFFGKYEPQPDSGIGTTLALFGAGLLDTVCSAVGAAISTL